MLKANFPRFASLAFAAITLASCSVVPPSQFSSAPAGATSHNSRYSSSHHASHTPSRLPVSQVQRIPALTNSAPVAMRPRSGAEAQCLADLSASGVRFDILPDRYFDQGCSTLNTVQMHALRGDRGQLDIGNLGPVTCPVSNAFAAWARFGVDRAARQIFGSPLASIETMGSYSCRNVAGSSRRSAHATGDAIDIGGFVLENGRRITLQDGWDGSAEEREFLQLVHRSACRRFDTVLGPDYNAAHADHFHVEGVIEGSSYCR